MKTFVFAATLAALSSTAFAGSDGNERRYPPTNPHHEPTGVIKYPSWVKAKNDLLNGKGYVENKGELFVGPEDTEVVKVSNRDVNRVACQGTVGDVIFSQEKPMSVTTAGSNVFVKFLVKRQGNVDSYVTQPADLHVVCDNQVFTMILHPRPVDSVTVRLGKEVRDDLQQIVADFGSLPIEEKVKKLTLAAYQNDVPPGFALQRMSGNLRVFSNLKITPLYRLVGPGSGLAATEYLIKPDRPMHFTEKGFLRTEFGDVIGVTVDPSVVHKAGDTARLIIVERVLNNE